MSAGVNGSPARVLMTADAVGGVWPYALDLARGFAGHGIDTVLAVLGPSPGNTQREALRRLPRTQMIDTGLPLDWTARSEQEARDTNARLVELAAAARPDIVHLNAPALAAFADYPAPVATMAHSCVATWWRTMRTDPMPEDFRWRARAVRSGLERADVVLAATRSFAAALADTHGRNFAVEVVPNGRTPAATRGEKKRHVLAAGRLWDEAKNLGMLDRTAARIDAPVFAAGACRGPNGATAGFAHLTLLGELGEEEMARRHAEAAVFASPARYEPFGLAVLEAAQAGAALVLSDIPSFRELWEDAALFVPPEDEAGWASALQGLLDAPPLRHRLAAAARERAREYSPERMVAGTLAVYHSLLATETR